MNGGRGSSRKAVSATSAGIVWEVTDFASGDQFFSGRGLLFPFSPANTLWRALEVVRHPQVARVEVIGAQVWVQYEPETTQVPPSGLDVAGVLAALGEAGIDARRLPASKVLSVTGRSPLLVCLAVGGLASASWKTGAWFAHGLESESRLSSRHASQAVAEVPGAGGLRGRGTTNSKSDPHEELESRSSNQDDRVLADTRPLPLIKRPGSWKISAVAGACAISVVAAGILWSLVPVSFECPGEDELAQIVANLLVQRAQYMSVADVEGLATVELPELHGSDVRFLEDAAANRRQFLASPLDVVVTDIDRCGIEGVRLTGSVRALPFEACTADLCINVPGTVPESVEVELEPRPWRLSSIRNVE